MILWMMIGVAGLLSAWVCLFTQLTEFLIDTEILADDRPLRCYATFFFSSFRQGLFFSSSSCIPGYLPQPATQKSPRLLTDL